ncbi:MAG TPA: acyl carrier protein [Marinilabiliaceae bacterium]|nr:acyl carrier protein [Marinilabiliaceae bacterium]
MEQEFLEMITEVFEIEGRNLSMEDAFRDYEEWDSLVHLSLIAEIDDVYDITIEDDTFKELTTLNELYKEIQKRTEA